MADITSKPTQARLPSPPSFNADHLLPKLALAEKLSTFFLLSSFLALRYLSHLIELIKLITRFQNCNDAYTRGGQA